MWIALDEASDLGGKDCAATIEALHALFGALSNSRRHLSYSLPQQSFIFTYSFDKLSSFSIARKTLLFQGPDAIHVL
jgi:hypothetical protein